MAQQMLKTTRQLILLQKRLISTGTHLFPNQHFSSVSTLARNPVIYATTHPHDGGVVKPQTNQKLGQVRYFGKRGKKAAMGHHLEKLDELAHRLNKGEKKKGKTHNDPPSPPPPPEEEEFAYDDEEEDDDDEDEGEETVPTLPSVDKTRKRMQSILNSMENAFRSIRGAEPSPELFENIEVVAYGSTVQLNTVAQVIISSPSLAVLACYDPSTTTNVRDAVRDAGLNFNPRIDDPASGEVQVPIPKVSTETRMTLVKQLHKMTERYKTRVRNVRKKANDKVKKGKDGKLEGISKDDAFRVGKEIDDLTHEISEKISLMLQEKEDAIKGV